MFLLKILFKLLPLGKCFLMSFKNILSIFVLILTQYGGLNHMILCLCVFFLFALVSVVSGVNVKLSWKPPFLSASKYIGNNSRATIWFSADVYRHIFWSSKWSIYTSVSIVFDVNKIKTDPNLLNKIAELVNTCCHQGKLLLKSFKKNPYSERKDKMDWYLVFDISSSVFDVSLYLNTFYDILIY